MSPTVMAQALHATVTNGAIKSLRAGLPALRPIADQLVANGQLSVEGMSTSKQLIVLPSAVGGSRSSRAALRAAYQTIAETSTIPLSASELKRRFVAQYLLELCRVQFLGILEGRGVGVYFHTASDAQSYSVATQHELLLRLSSTVDEIVTHLDEDALDRLQLTRVKMPKKLKRDEAEILQDEVLVKLDI